MWSMMVQTRMDRLFLQTRNLSSSNKDNFLVRSTKFTVVVPSNSAWEKAQMNFNKAYNTLIEGQFPQYVSCVLCCLQTFSIFFSAITFTKLLEMGSVNYYKVTTKIHHFKFDFKFQILVLKKPQQSNNVTRWLNWHVRRLCNFGFFVAFLVFFKLINTIPILVDRPSLQQHFNIIKQEFET